MTQHRRKTNNTKKKRKVKKVAKNNKKQKKPTKQTEVQPTPTNTSTTKGTKRKRVDPPWPPLPNQVTTRLQKPVSTCVLQHNKQLTFFLFIYFSFQQKQQRVTDYFLEQKKEQTVNSRKPLSASMLAYFCLFLYLLTDMLLLLVKKSTESTITFQRFTAKDREEMWNSSKSPYHNKGTHRSTAIQLKIKTSDLCLHGFFLLFVFLVHKANMSEWLEEQTDKRKKTKLPTQPQLGRSDILESNCASLKKHLRHCNVPIKVQKKRHLQDALMLHLGFAKGNYFHLLSTTYEHTISNGERRRTFQYKREKKKRQ